MLATNLPVNDKITASYQTNISPKELTSNKNVRGKTNELWKTVKLKSF